MLPQLGQVRREVLGAIVLDLLLRHVPYRGHRSANCSGKTEALSVYRRKMIAWSGSLPSDVRLSHLLPELYHGNCNLTKEPLRAGRALCEDAVHEFYNMS